MDLETTIAKLQSSMTEWSGFTVNRKDWEDLLYTLAHDREAFDALVTFVEHERNEIARGMN